MKTNKELIVGVNDFATLYSEVAKEWHPTLNGDKKPSDFMPGSGYRAWWKCSKCGHEWQTRILHRRNGVGCPKCGKEKATQSRNKTLLQDRETLAHKYPELISEWDYELNAVDPKEITYGSNKKYFWKCLKGHPSFLDTIGHRVNGRGCPVCSGHKVISGINDLQTLYPEIAASWDYDKNKIKPNEIGLGGNKTFWWKCEKGHSYDMLVHQRIRGQNCPYCSNHRLLVGFNDLETTNPELAKEWDYEGNYPLTPRDIVVGNHNKFSWVCSRCGHKWKVAPHTRLTGTGCPKCSSERQTSFPEQAILFYFSKITDVENRYVLDGFELDIYLPLLNAGIEYDGILYHSSDKAKTKEERKNKHFKSTGLRVIRVKEIDSGDSFVEDDVIYYRNKSNYSNIGIVVKLLIELLHLNQEITVDLDSDRTAIYSAYLTLEKENSILSKRPEIASEWDYEKNKGINPDTISYTSGKKIHWKCDKGHTWIEDASHRYRGHNCPYCSGHRVWPGFNDVATLHPEAAYFWDDDNLVKPEEVSFGSEKKVNLHCPVCGHKWKTGVWYIVKNPKCPKCKHSIKK